MRALAVAFGAVFVLVTAGCGDESTADLPLGRELSAAASLTPGVHPFAEPVTARVDVVVDREHLDPDRFALDAKFLPYDIYDASESREDRGRITLLRYEWVLRCLRLACIPELLSSAAGEAETGRGERRTLRLPPAEVVYDDPAAGKRVVARAKWPDVVSVSRIRQSDVPRYGYLFKTSVTPLPDPDYRIPPALLGGGLLAAALALLVLPIGLAVVWIRRRRPEPLPVEKHELTPLERALRLVEWASGREDGVERREALERLAFELDALDRSEAAESVRALAWSASTPTPDAAGVLVEAVRVTDGWA
jgi:hypothetical protein